MNRGVSAESPRADRNLFMAAFRLGSKSTKVSCGPELLLQFFTRDQFARTRQQHGQDFHRLPLQPDL